MNRNTWELFTEQLAEILALMLSDKEAQAIIDEFHRFSNKVKELSNTNLRQLELEAETKRYFSV